MSRTQSELIIDILDNSKLLSVSCTGLLHVSCRLLVLLGFSDNPGIAALWHDEKIRREWKDLSEDLVAPPSPGVSYK